VADQLSAGDLVARMNDRADRFIRHAEAADEEPRGSRTAGGDRDHPAPGEFPGVDDDSGDGREHLFAGVRPQVDATISR
jgi:hypothetical protein